MSEEEIFKRDEIVMMCNNEYFSYENFFEEDLTDHPLYNNPAEFNQTIKKSPRTGKCIDMCELVHTYENRGDFDEIKKQLEFNGLFDEYDDAIGNCSRYFQIYKNNLKKIGRLFDKELHYLLILAKIIYGYKNETQKFILPRLPELEKTLYYQYGLHETIPVDIFIAKIQKKTHAERWVCELSLLKYPEIRSMLDHMYEKEIRDQLLKNLLPETQQNKIESQWIEIVGNIFGFILENILAKIDQLWNDNEIDKIALTIFFFNIVKIHDAFATGGCIKIAAFLIIEFLYTFGLLDQINDPLNYYVDQLSRELPMDEELLSRSIEASYQLNDYKRKFQLPKQVGGVKPRFERSSRKTLSKRR